MNYRAFYKSLIYNPQTNIIVKFNQNGVDGFLPLNELGVCAFMSLDFARAVTEGRFITWRDKISSKDKHMIERLRAGQSRLGIESEDLHQLERTLSGKATAITDISIDNDDNDFQTHPLAAEKIFNAFRGFTINHSCMDSPCVYLNVTLTHEGLFEARPLGHGMMFTMAVTKNNTLDPEHLLFMDPGSGIFMIENNQSSIENFLFLIDKHLLSDYRVGEFRASLLDKSLWLPLKSQEEWQKQEQAIWAGIVPDNPMNYALGEECLIDEYLRLEINRLAKLTSEKSLTLTNLLFVEAESKLKGLKKCREAHLNFINDSKSQNEKREHWNNFKATLLESIDKLTITKRYVLGMFQSTSHAHFTILLNRLQMSERSLNFAAQT